MPSKIRIVDRFVNPYAGAFTCLEELNKVGLSQYLDEQLGARVKQAKYSFSDIILGWAITNFCHGRRLEDITHVRSYFNVQGLKMPSSDTLSRCIRRFATQSENITSKFGSTHQFNFNPKLNKLLIDVAKKLDIIDANENNILDYDGTLIPCEKYDSTFTYKQFHGYSPACGFIGMAPVYIEGRSGHTPAGFQIQQSIKSCLDVLRANGVSVKCVRSDSAAYTKQTIEYLNTQNVLFYIRASSHKNVLKQAPPTDQWKKVKMGDHEISVFSIIFPFGKCKNLRYVMQIDHGLEAAKQKNAGRGKPFPKPTIRMICTNDSDMEAEAVIRLYNARGKAELNFSALKSDFGWSRLPHSALNENVCFMYVSAIVHILYTYLIRKLSCRKLIDISARLKRFIVAIIERIGWFEEDGLILCQASKPPPSS